MLALSHLYPMKLERKNTAFSYFNYISISILVRLFISIENV